MTTLSEDIATHISDSWDTDSGNNPKPTTIASKSDTPNPSILEADNIIVLPDEHATYRNLSPDYRITITTITVQIVAKSTVSDQTDYHSHLKRLVDEVEHVLNHKNHKISGYYDHSFETAVNRSKPMGGSSAEGLNKVDGILTLYKMESR